MVGLGDGIERTDLVPGGICILDPMCPHHFETPYGNELVVAPLHVFSSVYGTETNHPMFNGTYLMNQGLQGLRSAIRASVSLKNLEILNIFFIQWVS